jgi:hemerythrin superfamily protein
MTVQLEDSKRNAIACKLADMKALQNLLIANEEMLVEACPDREITNRFEDFLRDDRKNLGILDTVIVQYGIKAEPKESIQKEIEQVETMMKGSDLTLFEKVAKHELLKHTQAMSGLLVHKAGQVVGADIAVAISPLNTVNFENRAHQEQLQAIMEVLSTLELTGKPADQSLWARAQDAVAALTGIAGGMISRTDNEINIRDLIKLDHTKVNTLFAQIRATEDPQKLQEFFGQLYQDLSAHSEAEEQVLYPVMRAHFNDIQKLYDEQAEMKVELDRIKSMNPAHTADFKDAVESLMSKVVIHVNEEENDLFRTIKDTLGDEQQKSLATEFKSAKSKIQDRRLAEAAK